MDDFNLSASKMDMYNVSTNFTDDSCMSNQQVLWYLCVALINNPVAVYVDRYITPIWYVIGLIGNIITIKIWSCRRMKRFNNSALYLIVLACTDLMCLLLHIFIELKYAWGYPTLDFPLWCPTYFVLYMFSQYMSPLLVFGFTMKRFISIIRPFKSERFSRRHRAPKEVLIIAAFAIAISGPQAHGWVYNETIQECVGSETEFFHIWSWASDMFVFGLFPVATFLLNICVMVAASRASAQRRQTLCRVENGSSKDNRRRTSKLPPSTLTIVCISFYRIFTTLPVGILFALQYNIQMGNPNMPVRQMSQDPQWQTYFLWIKAKKIIDEIGISQYSCNIFIYILTARQFRHEIFNLFNNLRTCSKLKASPRHHYDSVNGTVSMSHFNHSTGQTAV